MRRFMAPLVATLLAAPAAAQDAADLAKQLANPVASLISVPLQFNYDGGYGARDGDRAFVNIQPVVPVDVAPEWNLISRTILPVIWQDDVVGSGSQFGLGDTVQSLFLSPKAPTSGGLIWGVGPVLLLPTATDDALGGGKWGAGPTAVALRQSGPWTYGALANHIWSFAGEAGRRDVNATFLQPFVTYTTPSAMSFFLNTETTSDWEGDDVSIPINAGVNQLLTVGGQMVQVGAGLRYWLEAPESGPEGFGARATVVFLFPR